MGEATAPISSEGRFVSDNCVDVWMEEPGDYTVRPIPPGPRLERAKAERLKIYGSSEPGVQPPPKSEPE